MAGGKAVSDMAGGVGMGEGKAVSGFWAGLRFGLGFVAALALSAAAFAGVLLLVGWLAFGSVRNMAVAAASEVASVAMAGGRGALDHVSESATQARDRAVATAGEAARKVTEGARGATEVVRDGAAAAGEKASAAKEAVRERAGGLMGRFGWGRASRDPAEGGEDGGRTPGGGAAPATP